MKILVVRFSAIGDCVITAWAVTALRKACPDARIVWAVQERCAPVIDLGRLVDSIHVVPRERWKKHRWSPAVWRQQVLTYTALRKERFDIGFDFQGHSKTALMLRLSGCKQRFASRATDAFAAKLNPPEQLTPAGPHEVDRAMSLVKCAFEAETSVVPVMPETADTTVPGLGTGPWPDLVTIQTGAGEPKKACPPQLMRAIAGKLLENNWTVAAIGGAQDPTLDHPIALDLVGKLTLEQSMALIARSQVHIAADTGTGHIAAAYGVPVVSLFGPTDAARFRPFTERGIVIQAPGPISDIAPRDVVDAVQALQEKTAGARPH